MTLDYQHLGVLVIVFAGIILLSVMLGYWMGRSGRR
jgi:hypothetical protein